MTASPPRLLNQATTRLLLIVLIVALGMLLRLWNLNKESFWADEGWTVLLAKGPTLSDVVQTMADDQHPPLYFILMNVWMRLTGNSEITMRLLSTFWSVLGVAALYRLGADLFSPGAGLAAALMLALADNDIMLAQEARHYTQMATLAVLSTLFYFRYLRRPDRWNGIGWLLASTAMMYTHYLGGFVLIVQLVHAVCCVRPAPRLVNVLLRWGAICVAWLPWAYVFLEQSLVRYERPILFQSSMSNTPETYNLVRGDLVGSQFGLTVGLLLLGLVYVAYRDGKPWITWRPASKTFYAALWLVVPIVSIVAINARFPILTTRNFLIVTPAIMLLIGHGLMNLDRTARAFALTVLVIVSLITVDAYLLKPPWREVAQGILRYRMGEEPVIMDVWVDDFALRYHLGRDLNSDPAMLPLVSMPEWRARFPRDYFSPLLQFLSDKDAFWLAYKGKNEDNLLGFFVQHGFTRTATQVFLHRQDPIFLYRYDRVPERTLATFADIFELHGAAVQDLGANTYRVNLLWKPLKQPTVDFSVSVFLLDASGKVVGQHDSPPLEGKSSTLTWSTESAYFDSHTLSLRSGSAKATRIGVKVYWYVDPKPLSVNIPGEAAVEDFYTLDLARIASR